MGCRSAYSLVLNSPGVPWGSHFGSVLEFDIVIHLPPLLRGKKARVQRTSWGPGLSGLWCPDESDMQGERGDLGMMGVRGRKGGS